MDPNYSKKRLWKAFRDSFRGMSFSEILIWAKWWTKPQEVLYNSTHERSSRLLRGVQATFYKLMERSSIYSFPGLTTCPRYVTVVHKNLHFEKSNSRWTVSKMRTISATWRRCSSTGFEKRITPSRYSKHFFTWDRMDWRSMLSKVLLERCLIRPGLVCSSIVPRGLRKLCCCDLDLSQKCIYNRCWHLVY